MSFHGGRQFDSTHPTEAPGFSTAPDPFAGIVPVHSHSAGADEDEGIDFEETYDGLGNSLDETDDVFNEDTFGNGDDDTYASSARDFDFAGNTTRFSGVLQPTVNTVRTAPAAATLLNSTNSPQRFNTVPSARSFKTGYERYKVTDAVPDLQVDPNLWGTSTGNDQFLEHVISRPTVARPAAGSRNMMSLEEVEAAMQTQSQTKKTPFGVAVPVESSRPSEQSATASAAETPHLGSRTPIRILQHDRAQPKHYDSSDQGLEQCEVNTGNQSQPNLKPTSTQILPVSSQLHGIPPRRILQNPSRTTDQPQRAYPLQVPAHQRGLSDSNNAFQRSPNMAQLPQPCELSEEERLSILVDDTKRAKRNHKIFLLSKGNGLMTPQDKNFITRIQLQQLVSATSGTNAEPGSNAMLAEDFYYQVYHQIETRPNGRQQQSRRPAHDFAQTYLFQTGGRQHAAHRRQMRGDTHIHRMQQQVQRAVEAAKAKPKNKQLVIEGSLGKIAFTNAKTPKPLVTIKKSFKVSHDTLRATDRKTILKNIELVYTALMKVEDHERCLPPVPVHEQDSISSETYQLWRQDFLKFNQELWSRLKVMEPITADPTTMHPFIAFLSYPKGKKAVPRIFHSLDPGQRLTVLTSIMVQLDSLDVVRLAQPENLISQNPSYVQEQQDVFITSVMPTLFSFVTEAPLDIIIGLVGLFLDRVNVFAVLRSRAGVEILTMLLSQAEIIHKGQASNEREWKVWLDIYQRLFDSTEPFLAEMFPRTIAKDKTGSSDIFVWQFLAALGSGASPEQQQRLVLAVKDHVMHVIEESKTLSTQVARQRRSNVNLFMQAIGLDVDLLDN